MTKVVGVRFRQVGKIYFFAPGQYNVEVGQHVIVETARGIEYGHVVLGEREVEDSAVSEYRHLMMMKGKLRTGKRKKKRIRYVLRRLRSIILK